MQRTESASRYVLILKAWLPVTSTPRPKSRFSHHSTHSHSFGSSSAALAAAATRSDEEYDYEKANFEIHEDAQGNVFVKDLAMVTVTSREEVDALVQSGLKLRATHETKMNAVSSRSHTVFTIHIFQQSKHSTTQVCLLWLSCG